MRSGGGGVWAGRACPLLDFTRRVVSGEPEEDRQEPRRLLEYAEWSSQGGAAEGPIRASVGTCSCNASHHAAVLDMLLLCC